MAEFRHISGHLRTGNRAAIRLSFLLALGLHAVFFLLPRLPESPKPQVSEVRIEIQFSDAHSATAEPLEPEPLMTPEAPESAPESEQTPVLEKKPVKQLAEIPLKPEIPETAPESLEPATPYARKRLEQMDEIEKRRLTNSLLSRQFIKEELVTEQLFGKVLATPESGIVADFRVPIRPSMVTMLDKPMPDLPFAYQEGLIHFAYAPGVKGDLQRFWDVITPEIAFRTKYGTEVRCIWVLIIGGCAWK